MKNARTWFFHRFLLGMGAFLALQTLLIGVGVPWLLRLHEEEQTRILAAEALKIILNHAHQPSEEVLAAGPFLVYDSRGELLFSNRGMGRGLPANSRAPVVWEGQTLGWVYNGETAFLNQEANVRFLVTLAQLFLLSLAGSMVIALVWAAHHGKRIALLFGELRTDITQIALRKEVDPRTAPFVELAAISHEMGLLGRTLSQTDQKQKDFLQDVTHDLRTPLAGLKSQLEAMGDGVLPLTRERLSGLLSETDRMETLITDLSFLFRTESSSQFTQEEISLPHLLEDLRFRFEGAVTSRFLLWATDLRQSTLQVNRFLLERALTNLVDNALNHADGMSRITLGSEVAGGNVRIWVEDDGPGIPEDMLPRIFERHFRGNPGRSTKGSGLGLSIVQAVVQKHGGNCTAENVKPRGFRISLSFPLHSV